VPAFQPGAGPSAPAGWSALLQAPACSHTADGSKRAKAATTGRSYDQSVEDAEAKAHKAIVAGLFQVINERRLDELGEYLAVDVVDDNKGFLGDEARSEDAFDGIPAQFALFDSYVVEVEEVIAEGARVVALVTQRGVSRGTGGRAFENQAVYLFTMSGKKICRVRAIGDRSEPSR
jgi:ketosteroid isomerase-like protein